MSSYFEMACPRCLNSLRIRDEYSGRRVVCKHCEQDFLAEAIQPAETAGASEPTGPDPALAAEVDALRAENDRLGILLREKEERLALLGSEAERSRARLDEAAAERDRERAAWGRSLDESRGRWDAERRALDSEVGRLRLEADSRERELQEVRLRAGMIARERDELLARLDQSEDRASRREAELGARVAELSTASAEADRRSRDEAERLNRDLELSRARERAEAGRVEELSGRLRDLEAERDRRSAEMEALRVGRWVEAAAIRRQSEEDARGHREESERLRAEAEAARGERDRAVEQVAAASHERDRLSGLLNSLEFRHRDAERALTDDLERLSESLAEAREERDAATRRAEELSAVIAGLRSDLDEERRARESEVLRLAGGRLNGGHGPEATVIEVEVIDEPDHRNGHGTPSTNRSGAPIGFAQSRNTEVIRVGGGNGRTHEDPGEWISDRISDVEDLGEARHRIELLAGWLRESIEANSRLLDLMRGQREAAARHRPHARQGWLRRGGEEVGEDRWEHEFNWHLQVGRQLAEMQKRRGQR